MTVVVPDGIRNVTGLGAPGQAHRAAASERWGVVVFAAILAVAGIAAAYWGALIYPNVYPDVAGTNSPAIVIVGVLMVAGAAALGWYVVRKWNETAALYEDGLAHFDGRRVRTVRWADVESFTSKVVQMSYYGVIPAGTQRKYTLVDRSGQKIKLEGLSHITELADTIREAVFPYISERCRKAYAAGEPVSFGAVTIDPLKGITVGHKTIAWSDIGSVKLESGELKVKPRQGGIFSGATAQVPKIANLDVLLVMVNEIAQQQGGPGA